MIMEPGSGRRLQNQQRGEFSVLAVCVKTANTERSSRPVQISTLSGKLPSTVTGTSARRDIPERAADAVKFGPVFGRHQPSSKPVGMRTRCQEGLVRMRGDSQTTVETWHGEGGAVR
ncbi:hypothetical protein R1flu_000156 [Riccia fluitans]|uniref:Uncharacterized protein n=1 Tax=Riccia fluitans TaxID=41844 RepID=A0ABD1XZZ5_9MARC